MQTDLIQTKTDSTKANTNNTIEEGLNSVLGGIIGGKEKTKEKNPKIQLKTTVFSLK